MTEIVSTFGIRLKTELNKTAVYQEQLAQSPPRSILWCYINLLD